MNRKDFFKTALAGLVVAPAALKAKEEISLTGSSSISLVGNGKITFSPKVPEFPQPRYPYDICERNGEIYIYTDKWKRLILTDEL